MMKAVEKRRLKNSLRCHCELLYGKAISFFESMVRLLRLPTSRDPRNDNENCFSDVSNKIIFLCTFVFLGFSFDGSEDSPYRLRVPLGLDEYIPIPEDNPITPKKIELGKQLFFDKRLSRDGTIACASCHIPEQAFTNGTRVAIGIKDRRGIRNVPTIVNRAYGKLHFLDGRAASLEEQALEPIQNPKEMGMSLGELEQQLNSIEAYKKQFADVFGGNPTAQLTAKALAAFVRTLLSGNSAYDRFVHGDREALSETAKRGLQIFRGKGNCIACHVGPNFTDEKFHNTGVAYLDTTTSDWGRYTVTKQQQDKGAFKTPTLREISGTPPYMHSGVFAAFQDVVEFYNQGGKRNPNLDTEIKPLNLSQQEKNDLVEFLRSLNGEGWKGRFSLR